MTLDTTELRRLLDEARLESGFGNRAQWTDENGDALLDAADRLARIEAVMADVTRVMDSLIGAADAVAQIENTGVMDDAVTEATAALAALRELIGADA